MTEGFEEHPNVELSGFGEVSPQERIAMGKILGNYSRVFSDRCENFEKLRLTMKRIHQSDDENTKAHKIQIHGKLIDNGKNYTSEVTDHELLSTLDRALKKLEHSVVE